MIENQDILLFSKVQQGNRDAFTALFRLYYEPMARFVFRFVKDADTAEEVTQEMFIHFWENAPRINIATSLKAYLYTSARNFSLNYIKKNSIREKYHELAESQSQKEIDTSENVESGTIFTHLLKESLETLPAKCREIFEMSKFEGLSYDEIAEYLELSKKTVENQMGIALRKIREWMQPHLHKIYD